MDYSRAMWQAGMVALMSMVCRWCYRDGDRTPYFGVPVTGTMLGRRPQDQEFQKNIWKAAKNHLWGAHSLLVVRNRTGGWKVTRSN